MMNNENILVSFILTMNGDAGDFDFSWSRKLDAYPDYEAKVLESDLAPVHVVGKGSRKAKDKAMLWNLDPHVARNAGKKTRNLGQCERCYTSHWEGDLA